MNEKLRDNPNYQIPDKFKKVHERQVEFQYKLPASLKIPEPYTICYEIVNQMLESVFDFQTIEPQAKFYYSTIVKLRENARFFTEDKPSNTNKKPPKMPLPIGTRKSPDRGPTKKTPTEIYNKEKEDSRK